VAAAGGLVGWGASVPPQAARVTPAAVTALTRKKSRRLSFFSSILSSLFIKFFEKPSILVVKSYLTSFAR
jgi:hypothetical protein